MSDEYALWKLELRRAICNLCAIEFQQSGCWIGASSAGATFREAMSRLYDASQFVEFLTYQAWRQAGLDDAAGDELNELRLLLDAYDEPDTDAGFWPIRPGTQYWHK